MQQTTTTLSLYIPRLLANVKQNKIKTTFHELNIGNVYYVDMHYRVNEKRNPYYFAFISITLYLTPEATEFYRSLLHNRIVNIIYDSQKGQYWEVKLHIEKENRYARPPSIELPVTDVNDYNTGLDNEYDILQREIFDIVLHRA